MANSSQNRDQFAFSLHKPHLLMEGFAEYFARQVMHANRAVFGPIGIQAYEPEVRVISRLIVTMGEQSARDAYFRGDASALRRLDQAIAINMQVHPDLLVPDFMIP